MTELDSKNYIKMTETPIAKLVLSLAVPTTISMLITGIYNTADTFFVSKISVSASGATGIVFALMALIQGLGFMFGHGAGSNISRLLGAKENEKASIFASTSFFLSIIIGTIFGILGMLFIEPLMYLLGSTDTILTEARIYATYILIGAPALMCSCVMNNILRYEGRATYSMFGLSAGGILNMFLDPILIFGFDMGMHGAGLSTALSQYVSAVILLIPFIRGKTSSKFKFRYFTLSSPLIQNIILTGLPNLTRQGLSSISTAVLNLQASAYGDAAIASFSIATRCANLIFAFSIGLCQGFQPVAAFNYGAKKYNRVRKAFLFTIITSICILCTLGLLCFVNTEGIIKLFRDEPSIIQIGSETLKYMCFGIIMIPFSAAGSMLFQGAGKKGRALLLSMLQSGLIHVPLMFILPSLLGLKGLEMSQAAAYFIAALISLPFLISFLSDMKEEKAG